MKREERNPKKLRRIFYDILEKRVDRKMGVESAMKIEGEWNRGYTMAMNAILNLQKTKRSTLQLDLDTPLMDLSFFYKRFKELSKDGFLRKVDHGYFTSWRDYLSYISSKKKASNEEEIDK